MGALSFTTRAFYTHAEWIFPSALPWHSPRRVDFFSLAYFIVVVVVDVVLPRQIWILWLPSVCRQARRKKSEFHLPSHIKKENVSLEYLQRTSRLTRRRDDNELAPPKYFIFFMRCLEIIPLMRGLWNFQVYYSLTSITVLRTKKNGKVMRRRRDPHFGLVNSWVGVAPRNLLTPIYSSWNIYWLLTIQDSDVVIKAP